MKKNERRKPRYDRKVWVDGGAREKGERSHSQD